MEKEELSGRIGEIVARRGFSLYEIELPTSGNGNRLNITVDREEPTGLDELSALSEELSVLLDELDPFASPYVMDVNTLGVEKPIALSALAENVGRYVSLHLSRPYKGENTLEGELAEVGGDTIKIKVNRKGRIAAVELPIGDIDRARRAVRL